MVNSTSDWAKELAELGAAEGTVTIAEAQTAGRGRFGREWISPMGGLWFSIVLRPRFKPLEAVKLVFVAGLAVADVLREIYSLRVETKWPNDVLVNGLKVCGILAEMNTTGEKVNYVVVGIGVNANFDVKRVLPEKLRNVATSLEKELGKKVKLEELFRALLERIESVYEQFIREGFAPVLKGWKSYAGFLDCAVEVTNENERLSGLALDVDDEGALALKLKDGTIRRVFIGDVSLRTL
jgi:BirA family biotin operon repressor/biotin-[acetyl-CoA-carboxylase] ligase